MKSITRFSRIIFVVLSFMVLLLSGCGGGSDSTPTEAFTTNKVSGKTFAYSSSTGSTGTLAFNGDSTWSTTIGTYNFSGTWSVNPGGKLVCVTTAGGDHTNTYTLLTTSADAINASVVEVNPSDPSNPASYTVTLTAAFTANQVSGKTFAYSSSKGDTGTLAFNAGSTWSTTIGTSTFSGTWSIDSNGRLVCSTAGVGGYTNTYTQLINNSTSVINTSVSELNPAIPDNPKSYNATLTKNSSVSATVDYSKSQSWLSLPANSTIKKNVDIFYVYPTVWSKPNAAALNFSAIDDPAMIAPAAIAYQTQATAFETLGNIYAPYYRQADAATVLALPTIDAIYNTIDGLPATDVISAFDYYIKNYNNNRPFILVGHSQGSTIVALLLKHYMKDNPQVYARMIAAYAPGWSFTPAYFNENPNLKAATGPDDTGVIVSWNTEATSFNGTNPVLFPGASVINPINWHTDNTPALAAENLGSLGFGPTGMVVSTTVPNYADATVDTVRGVVRCSTVNPASLPTSAVFPSGIFHSFDIPFYYQNIRANAANRIAKYLGT